MKPTFLKQMVPRRGLGHTSATPAALASAAFRVLTQSAQALCFLGSKMKKGRHKADLFKTVVPRRGLGHTSATPAALASAAFRVLAQSAQALCFLG
ncbi:TPA: hypothetical protein RJR38_004698 [Burkholderia multivorans]|nr:hypothetical protein [Burkholderia multivorans]